MIRGLALGLLPGLLTASSAAYAETSVVTDLCFDALVSARVVRQVPSVIPELDGKDAIIMSWPYFIDLNIVRVHEGKAPKGPSTMLSIQHTFWRKGLGVRKWRLRRNTVGGFNILPEEADHQFVRCPQDGPAADPYIIPGKGRTFQDLIREGIERHGQRP